MIIPRIVDLTPIGGITCLLQIQTMNKNDKLKTKLLEKVKTNKIKLKDSDSRNS